MSKSDFSWAIGSQWGQVVLQLASQPSVKQHQYDAELDQSIYLTGRLYTGVQLGMLDGPGRYRPKDDPVAIMKAYKSGKAALTKKQRRKLRKLRRAAARKGEAFSEAETIRLIAV